MRMCFYLSIGSPFMCTKCIQPPAPATASAAQTPYTGEENEAITNNRLATFYIYKHPLCQILLKRFLILHYIMPFPSQTGFPSFFFIFIQFYFIHYSSVRGCMASARCVQSENFVSFINRYLSLFVQ